MQATDDEIRFHNEVWLHVRVVTMTFYDFGWTDYTPAVGDLVDIHNRWRERGVIK